ncbi:uncharacterized protein BYT42DRAFT_582156 [Radiomyces spectabilis]|uniref:uncharacterized protein n=1 Tax=Radiomyces spectabilis TaxID=64574 RepID=UPI00221F2585|nr:uncharacterized protein BYT42DRAFT_582156 [Radiomyces spectabilis]KAI8370374.1 hypothetical protein BYT42DRAFT_582156 [Radiomyces spectabilis]
MSAAKEKSASKFWFKLGMGKHKRSSIAYSNTMSGAHNSSTTIHNEDDKKSRRFSGLWSSKHTCKKRMTYYGQEIPQIQPNIPHSASMQRSLDTMSEKRLHENAERDKMPHAELPKYNADPNPLANHVNPLPQQVDMERHKPLAGSAKRNGSTSVARENENNPYYAMPLQGRSDIDDPKEKRQPESRASARTNNHDEKSALLDQLNQRQIKPNSRRDVSARATNDSFSHPTTCCHSSQDSDSPCHDQLSATNTINTDSESEISITRLQHEAAQAIDASVIQSLQKELEQERSIVMVLQRQKQAIAKDLDYFSQTVDELTTVNGTLKQQLEQEKINNKQKEEDLNVLLEKLKAANASAREQSSMVDQIQGELESAHTEIQEEREKLQRCQMDLRDKNEESETLKTRLQEKDEQVISLKSQLYAKSEETDSLKSQLQQAHEQLQILKSTIEQLVKMQQSMNIARPVISASSPLTDSLLHTPSASPRIQPAHTPVLTRDEKPLPRSSKLPKSGSNLMTVSASTSLLPTYGRRDKRDSLGPDDSSSSSDEVSSPTSLQGDNLDIQLVHLTKKKEKLQSSYSKIPLSGGGPQTRRRKEELENMLDEVDSQLSKVKQKIKRM